MRNNMKSFAVYASGRASRIINFYSYPENMSNYRAKKVIYDGDSSEIVTLLSNMFGDDFFHFDLAKLDKKEQMKPHTTTSKFIHSIMNEFSIDYLLCFGGKILKKEFIDAYPNRLINFHPSILPAFKGVAAIDQAISAGVEVLGNTAHYIDEGIDTGEIILQTVMDASEFENYEDVLELQLPMIEWVLVNIVKIKRKRPFVLSSRKKKYSMSIGRY
tara:strand:+ start:101 stop:748 length:648 start_codon:yes stop_codon:yes gene_type:complete